MKNFLSNKVMIVLCLLFTGLMVGCKKAEIPTEAISPNPNISKVIKEDALTSRRRSTITTTTTPPPTTTTTTPPPPGGSYSLSVNWNGRPDGPYGYNQAMADFKNVYFWGDPSRSQVSGGTLRTTLLKNALGGDGGVISRIDVPDAPAYQLQFDMMFDSQFDFSAGGKLGFGFLIGAGQTGGESVLDGSGGSARIMWYADGGRVYLKPYLYYRDQPGIWGDDFGKTYPATGSIAKGQWHTVKIYVKSNTGSNTDGRIQIIINGTTLIDQAIRWTTQDAQRMTNNVCFETFRGGGETYWQSATDGNIYFNNVSYTAF